VLAPQTITHPGADAGAAGDLKPSLHKGDRRIVIDGCRMHRTDDTQLVHDASEMGHDFAEPCATLPVLLKLERRARDRKRTLPGRHAGQSLTVEDRRRRLLTVYFVQMRLVIERVVL